jgi:hypothetical protein
MVTSPPLAVAKVEEFTSPPSRTTKLDVLIVSCPASPAPKEATGMEIGT